MADGTSNSGMANVHWVSTGATDDLNIDSDNDTSSTVYFPFKGKIVRVAFQATTAVSTSGLSTPVKVEIYKNTSTLAGTWTLGLTVSTSGVLAAGAVAYADCAIALASATGVDGSAVYTASGSNGFNFNPGDWFHFKVVEPSAAGVGVTWIGYTRDGLQPGMTNVSATGSMA